MRPDQRQADQMRQVKLTPGYLLTAEGSVMIEFGNTRVLCAATLEDSVPQWLRGSGRGWVTGEYSMLPRATVTRTSREVNKGKPSGRTMEIQRLIGRSLRAVVEMEALGERSIIVDCDVIQADGGTRTAAITGGFVAMALAIKQLVKFKALTRSPIKEHVAAVSAGVVNGVAVLDLCYEEDSAADVDMNLVMTGAGQLVEVQATGEKSTFSDEQMLALMGLMKGGIRQLVELQKDVIASA
ncbi:MAG: ribonuclease PH [Bryobacterales bacterium]|nr:ribonuclease PH [Bryobacterales bacterium]